MIVAQGMGPSEDIRFLRREFLADRHLVIQSVNQACNLHCLYCRGTQDNWYDRLAQNAQAKILNRDRWPDLLRFCADRNVAEVLLTGGEPTIYPHLVDLVSILNDHGVRSAIHTHALNARFPRLLAELNRRTLHPNLHVSSELYEDDQRELRGSPLPHLPIANAAKAGFSVELKVVLHKLLRDRVEDLERCLLEWVKIGVRSIRFQPIVPVAGVCDERYLLDESCIPIFDKLAFLTTAHPVLSNVIRNTTDSFAAAVSLIEGTPLYRQCAGKCNIVRQITFFTTDLEPLTCKTLWDKNTKVPCEEIFDMVCVGYQL